MPFKDRQTALEYLCAYNKGRDKVDLNQRKAARQKAYRAEAPDIAPFCCIDSEGANYGHQDVEGYQEHRSFLWGAAQENSEVSWLEKGGFPLGSIEICDWLFHVKRLFKKSIFISFSFSYDVAQLLRDVPYETAWEIQRSMEYGKENEKPKRRKAFWRYGSLAADPATGYVPVRYSFMYIKGKIFTIYKYDPVKQGKLFWRKRKDGTLHQVFEYIATDSIQIFDVWGFFQSSLVRAIESMPGAASPEELAAIVEGKERRGDFNVNELDYIKSYTKTELTVTCRMMSILRQTMLDLKPPIKCKRWNGAGAVASALMEREKVDQHLAEDLAFENLPLWQQWAHHSFFGGRIECIQQGVTKKLLYNYDISSCYPAVIAKLSSMAGGTWEWRERPAPSYIYDADKLSILHVHAKFDEGALFYPLPYRRVTDGAILFPREVHGYYQKDDVMAAFAFQGHFGGNIKILGMWEFLPHSDDKPFHFVSDLFDFRASLPKTDIRQIVIKLGINSLYGKCAQRVGTASRIPKFASPWHAAAVTAGARRQLFEAALTDPEAIVCMMTDGIVSTRPLPLHCPKEKTLGAWELTELTGGVFLQSGVYALATHDGNWKTRTRGFRPANLPSGSTAADFLTREIPLAWSRDQPAFTFDLMSYMTLGQATRSREAWEKAGYWHFGTRELDLESPGLKRLCMLTKKEKRMRARKLMPTQVSNANRYLVDDDGLMILSAELRPDWVNDPDAFDHDKDDHDQMVVMSGLTAE